MLTRPIFNILAVCGSGAFAGALLTIGLTLGQYWRSLPPDEFLDWFSKNSTFVMRTIPFVLLPTLVGLVGSVWLSWPDRDQRLLWGSALACVILLLVVTAAGNGPLNSQFASKSVATAEVPGMLSKWMMFHAVRIALCSIASALAAIAMLQSARSH